MILYSLFFLNSQERHWIKFMNLEQFVQRNFDKNKTLIVESNFAKSLRLAGAIDLYKKTKDDSYINYAINCIKDRVSDDGDITFKIENEIVDTIRLGEVIFSLYKITGEEKYKNAIDKLSNDYVTKLGSADTMIENAKEHKVCIFNEFYATMPFYMNYETVFHKKEGYNDIIAKFDALRNEFFNEEKELYVTDESEFKTEFSALHAMTLIDTIENTSEEIYEHYKKLMVWFKETIKGVLKYQDKDSMLICESTNSNKVNLWTSLMTAYAMKKACKYSVLLSEKYDDIANDMITSILRQLNENLDDEVLGLLMKIAAI